MVDLNGLGYWQKTDFADETTTDILFSYPGVFHSRFNFSAAVRLPSSLEAKRNSEQNRATSGPIDQRLSSGVETESAAAVGTLRITYYVLRITY
jgi:hypothetical protein